VSYKARIHTDEGTPGKTLKYTDGTLHHIRKDGSHYKVTIDAEGNAHRPVKLNKKQRRKLRDEAPVDTTR